MRAAADKTLSAGPAGPAQRTWREGSLASTYARDTPEAMSEENVEIVRRLWEELQAGLERGDPGEWFDPEAVADDFEWIVSTPLDGRSVWRGREGFVEFMLTWTEQFDDWSIRVERWIDAGEDRVVALTRQTATGKGSRVPVELNLGQVWEFEAGRVARAWGYLDHKEALEAAGLRE
jgi:ketosteroid isomerase-like protein